MTIDAKLNSNYVDFSLSYLCLAWNHSKVFVLLSVVQGRMPNLQETDWHTVSREEIKEVAWNQFAEFRSTAGAANTELPFGIE